MPNDESTGFTVEVRPSGARFHCNDDETILQAATRSGMHLFSNCQKGECGSCKVRLKKGQIKLSTFMLSALSMTEIDADYTLACRSYPRTDLVIIAETIGMHRE